MTRSADKQNSTHKVTWVETPLGTMVAIADASRLYLLEFTDRAALDTEIERLRLKEKAIITPGLTPPLEQLQKELDLYFQGRLTDFETPVKLMGTTFQQKAWQALMAIPYGQTRSYLAQAKAVGREKAYRAVANANGANQLAIIIPCHRIINHNGQLGGYGGGLSRKAWLIEHEQKHAKALLSQSSLHCDA